MKKFKISIFVLVLYLLAGCDAGFDEINTSKTGVISINPAYLFNNAIIRTSFTQSTLVYEMAIVQQMITPNSGVVSGGNYNQDNRSVTQGMWQRYYRDVIKSLVDVINTTEDDPARSNLYNMARIWRAYTMMVLTDTYGDVPYAEAGKGYLENNVTPKYETQEAIYMSILEELETASAALDADKTIETADILYKGNVEQWKKFGYSTLLRAAMRLTEVDQTTAHEYVDAAVAGGLMESNADNAVIRHVSTYQNEVGGWLTSTEAANFYLARPFVDFLKANDDPRLASIAVRYVGAENGAQQADAIANKPSPAVISRDPEDQIGMPLGYNNTTINTVVDDEGLASFYDFSQLDRTRMGKNTSPVFLVTYAQTQLLLAEAVFRGWTTGNMSDLYSDGIQAHMEQMATYDAASAVSLLDITNYITAHPLMAGEELESINTQYWVASFLNGPEAFANFRRSGFPVLAPNTYPDASIQGDFINRLTYPDSEMSVNTENIMEAIHRQAGPSATTDNLDTRVWWDLP